MPFAQITERRDTAIDCAETLSFRVIDYLKEGASLRRLECEFAWYGCVVHHERRLGKLVVPIVRQCVMGATRRSLRRKAVLGEAVSRNPPSL